MCLPPYFHLGTETIKNISLIESAAALSSKSSPQCLLKKIDVITGEEAEYNVLKVCISYIALYRYKVALRGIKLSSTGTCFLKRQKYTLRKLSCLNKNVGHFPKLNHYFVVFLRLCLSLTEKWVIGFPAVHMR